MIWIIPALYAAAIVAKNVSEKSSKHISTGKSALFIGDSHTIASPSWAEAIKNKYGLKSIQKVAANGKTTDWMLAQVRMLKTMPDYVFIFGGANDAYNNIPQQKTLSNLQAIILYCQGKGAKVFVVKGWDLTGFQYKPIEQYGYANLVAFRSRYAALQKAMNGLKADKIIDTYSGLSRADSTDGLHLSMPTYKKFGEYVGAQVF